MGKKRKPYKPSVCTLYVVQKRDPKTGDMLPEFLDANAEGWTTYAECWESTDRADAVATLEPLSLTAGVDCEIVGSRSRTLSPWTKASKKRTG